MPIYAYRCESCGHAQDVMQKLADAPLAICPSCGADAFRKQLTAPAFQLKGSGWYVTDFRDGNKGKPAAAGDGPPDAGQGDAGKGDAGKGDAGKGDGAPRPATRPGPVRPRPRRPRRPQVQAQEAAARLPVRRPRRPRPRARSERTRHPRPGSRPAADRPTLR